MSAPAASAPAAAPVEQVPTPATKPEIKAAAPAAKPFDFVDFMVKFFGNEQGRDKFNKCVQYGSRFMAYYVATFVDAKSAWVGKWRGLFALTRDARKLPRWFKQFNEWQKIQQIAGTVGQTSLWKAVQILARAGFAGYWTFDMIKYFTTAKFIQDDPNYGKLSMFFWWVGITFSLLQDLGTLYDIHQQENAKRLALTTADDATKAKLTAELSALQTKKGDTLLNLPKNIGDFLVAGTGFDLFKNLFGANPNEGVLSIGGFVAGAVTCYQVFKTIVK